MADLKVSAVLALAFAANAAAQFVPISPNYPAR